GRRSCRTWGQSYQVDAANRDTAQQEKCAVSSKTVEGGNSEEWEDERRGGTRTNRTSIPLGSMIVSSDS
ncbi:hypothetical protein PMAYCL1PPCAC_30910, partial [Pristionchus mayeri]